MTSDTDLAGRHNEELATGKLVRMFLKHCRELFDLLDSGAPGSRKNRTPSW
jgi:hypothetical protein